MIFFYSYSLSEPISIYIYMGGSFPKDTYTAQLYVMGWLRKTWQNGSAQRQ